MNAPSEPNSTVKSPVDEFMLAEYSTIASAHFELHNAVRQSFRFYLGVVALPVTAAAVVLKDSFGARGLDTQTRWGVLRQLPPAFVLVLGVTAVVGILMYLAMVNTRLDIVLYTRSVNAVRAYFSSRAKEMGRADLDKYLNLPTDKSVPRYRERLRADWWSFVMMTFVNSAYGCIAIVNVLPICAATVLTLAFAGVHIIAYEVLGARREHEPIAGVRNTPVDTTPSTR